MKFELEKYANQTELDTENYELQPSCCYLIKLIPRGFGNRS